MKILVVLSLVLLGVVPLAFVAPLVAGATVALLFTVYRVSIWRRLTEERLMVEAHQAEARRRASLSYQV